GVVRLARASDVLGLCEGWETGLSVLQLYRVPVWAVLGRARMHLVSLPEVTRHVVIFADNDRAGLEAAEQTARLHRYLGRTAEIRLPSVGNDFNDELKS